MTNQLERRAQALLVELPWTPVGTPQPTPEPEFVLHKASSRVQFVLMSWLYEPGTQEYRPERRLHALADQLGPGVQGRKGVDDFVKDLFTPENRRSPGSEPVESRPRTEQDEDVALAIERLEKLCARLAS